MFIVPTTRRATAFLPHLCTFPLVRRLEYWPMMFQRTMVDTFFIPKSKMISIIMACIASLPGEHRRAGRPQWYVRLWHVFVMHGEGGEEHRQYPVEDVVCNEMWTREGHAWEAGGVGWSGVCDCQVLTWCPASERDGRKVRTRKGSTLVPPRCYVQKKIGAGVFRFRLAFGWEPPGVSPDSSIALLALCKWQSGANLIGSLEDTTRDSTAMAWHRLTSRRCELRLECTLLNGQVFGWKRRPSSAPAATAAAAAASNASSSSSSSDEWRGVLGNSVVALREDGPSTFYRCLNASSASSSTSASASVGDALRDLFQLHRPLEPLYATWSAADPAVCGRICPLLPGMRVMRQDPTECLFSFICSSNNNIARITQMLDKLRAAYGTVVHVDPVDGAQYHAFPSVDRLAACSEAELRALGFGYRAKYVRETARALEGKGGARWLEGLRRKDAAATRAALLEMCGVGPKVADCVALFALDKASCIPVDTHVWQIACRDLDPSLREAKSLTPKVYARVAGLFQDKYGPFAGWAHCVLFAAELPHFREMLPEDMLVTMAAARATEKALKQEVKKLRDARRVVKQEKQEEALRVKEEGGGGEEGGEGTDKACTGKAAEEEGGKTKVKKTKTKKVKKVKVEVQANTEGAAGKGKDGAGAAVATPARGGATAAGEGVPGKPAKKGKRAKRREKSELRAAASAAVVVKREPGTSGGGTSRYFEEFAYATGGCSSGSGGGSSERSGKGGCSSGSTSTKRQKTH